MYQVNKPKYWFRPIEDAQYEVTTEPKSIEFLKIWSGETFIHTGGTAYWEVTDGGYLNILSMRNSGITHYRILEN